VWRCARSVGVCGAFVGVCGATVGSVGGVPVFQAFCGWCVCVSVGLRVGDCRVVVGNVVVFVVYVGRSEEYGMRHHLEIYLRCFVHKN
jgi:hypothetical protein